jgi:hypothetical protein
MDKEKKNKHSAEKGQDAARNESKFFRKTENVCHVDAKRWPVDIRLPVSASE